MITAVAVLVALDMVCGIWAAYKRGEKITSAQMRHSVTKIIIYELALIVAFIAETYLLSDFIPITRIIAAAIGSSELKSLYENMSEISGDDLLKLAISKLSASEHKRLDK
jgi:hypothetical protein